MDDGRLILLMRQQDQVPQPCAVEQARHQALQRRTKGFRSRPFSGGEERMDQEAHPSPRFRHVDSRDESLASGVGVEYEILPHDRAVDDAEDRQLPRTGGDDIPKRDRTEAHRLRLDLVTRRAFDLDAGAGRHPEIVVRRQEEAVPFRPWNPIRRDAHLGVDEVK